MCEVGFCNGQGYGSPKPHLPFASASGTKMRKTNGTSNFTSFLPLRELRRFVALNVLNFRIAHLCSPRMGTWRQNDTTEFTHQGRLPKPNLMSRTIGNLDSLFRLMPR